MKYIPELEENFTANFLAKFRTLCYDAELNDPDEIKKLLFNSNKFFKDEFVRRSDMINSIDQIDENFQLFHEIVLDMSNIIGYGSFIALKNVSTGRYLSSCKINYTGSQKQVNCSEKEVPYNIESKFKLMHKETNTKLYVSTHWTRASDIINLKAHNTFHNYNRFVRSHDFTFTIGDETFYEVGHDDRMSDK
ncbi:988_t:CDS:2 [Funneliformis geosporum]|uniref:988_t:CDS:1 n=1 Tax=Funneliformis geosporum TaxID=1117311 RepID=A0A9W4SGJ7_9GLOM|nr:988_t:CDS:2 [Funneliformis geosporum]